ncbi:MAG: FkbM family methyltransferase [Candidatus Orphnella occulta]|nr:FkbM family methyltransferase [Candidatus Orphnella occulta]
MKLKVQSIINRLKSYVCEAVKRIEITNKLDYDKDSIYLHDNIRLGACKKEQETVKWIEGFGKNDIFFDIGANIGAYSLIASNYVKKVYAFEPSVFTYNVLTKNIYTNKRANITSFNIALSDSKKVGEFIYSSVVAGSSCHSFDKKLKEESLRQEMLSYSIDELIKDFDIPSPNHIKIDVDGAEFKILEGAVKTISESNFKSLLVEADEDSKQLFDFLDSLGLEKKQRHYISCDNIYNYLFMRRG